MQTEYEATFSPVEKNNMRHRLRGIGATLVKPEFLQKRTTFNPPDGVHLPSAWHRVRDEGDRITLSLKAELGTTIVDQKEVCLTVNDYAQAVEILRTVCCQEKAFQETKRELWKLGDVEVTIDEWPYLEPFVEVEGPNEEAVRDVAEKLSFDWSQAKFCTVGTLYSEKYGTPLDIINNHTPRIVFGEPNPFLHNQAV
jgi:adenylate cyclase class 2